MRELFRVFLKVAIIFIIAGIFINDTAAYIYTRYQGQDKADEIARAFVLEYNQSASIGSALNKATEASTRLGVNLVSYRVEGKIVEITIELTIEKTAIIQRVEPLKKLFKVKISATDELRDE